MPTEQDRITYKSLGYDKRLARGITGDKTYVFEGQLASGDLKGPYPRPQVIWDNGNATYDARYVELAGDTMTGNLLVTGYVRPTKIWHAYGGFQDKTETVAINADTWTHVTNAGNDLWTGLEADGLTLVEDEMVITNSGDYSGTVSITFEGVNTKDYLFRIYNVTQVEQSGYYIGATGLGSNNYANVLIPLYIEAAALDHIQLQVYQVDGNDATFLNSIFYLSYLHD